MTNYESIPFYRHLTDGKRLNLQLFADEEGSGSPGPDGGQSDETSSGASDPAGSGQQNEEPKAKYTDEDVDRMIARKRAEWAKQRDREQKQKDEAARLQNMSEEEKRNTRLQTLEEELASLKRERALGDMAKVARGLLADRHITVSDELVANLISEDAEATKSAVDSFADAFDKAVQAAVAERLKGKPPVAGSTGKKITREEIMKVTNARERQRLINENLDLFMPQK